MKIAAAQFSCALGDLKANVRKVREFSSRANEFGAVESGLTAALFGPIVSVVAGGLGTILVGIGVATIWPQTRKIGALDKSIRATDMTAAAPI